MVSPQSDRGVCGSLRRQVRFGKGRFGDVLVFDGAGPACSDTSGLKRRGEERIDRNSGGREEGEREEIPSASREIIRQPPRQEIAAGYLASTRSFSRPRSIFQG